MLDELERLERAATAGPWGEFAESGDWWVEGEAPDGGPNGHFVCGSNTKGENPPWKSQDDIDLMIAARNALPALLAVARAARECADDLEAEIRARYEGMLDHPAMLMRFNRDMVPVVHFRAALAALEEAAA